MEQAIPSVADYIEKKKEPVQVQVNSTVSTSSHLFSSPVEELIRGYKENFVDISRATMEYHNELEVHPEGDMEEDKKRQVKKLSLLYRAAHEMDTNPPVEYENGR